MVRIFKYYFSTEKKSIRKRFSAAVFCLAALLSISACGAKEEATAETDRKDDDTRNCAAFMGQLELLHQEYQRKFETVCRKNLSPGTLLLPISAGTSD